MINMIGAELRLVSHIKETGVRHYEYKTDGILLVIAAMPMPDNSGDNIYNITALISELDIFFTIRHHDDSILREMHFLSCSDGIFFFRKTGDLFSVKYRPIQSYSLWAKENVVPVNYLYIKSVGRGE